MAGTRGKNRPLTTTWREQSAYRHGGPRRRSGTGHSPRGDAGPYREHRTGGEWIYQSTLTPPQAVQKRYGLDPQVVQPTDWRPNLIQFLEAGDDSLPSVWWRSRSLTAPLGLAVA